MLKRSPKLKRYFKSQFLIKHAFSTMLNKHTDRAGKEVYTILNYKVPERYEVLMLAMVLSVMGFAGVEFWDYLLFEKSHNCSTDSRIVCFPIYPSMTTPRLDCSDTSYLKDNNITSIICYRLVLRLSTAAASALGVVATYALIIIIFTLLILKVSNGSGWNKRRAVLTIAIQIIIVVISLVLAISAYISLTMIYYTIEKQIIMITANGFMTCTLSYSTVFFPWWSFKKIKDNVNDNEDDDKENDEEDKGEHRRLR